MFRDESEKQLKYAIRKKKTGGGAASFVIGSVIFGGMMLGTMTANADTVATNDTSNDAVTNQTGTDSTADATTTLKATTTPVATASSEGNLESTATAATDENTTSTKPVNTASEATSKVETASSTSEVASSQADSTSTASEEASSAVANTNDKLQTSETSTPQASGTDLTRRAIAAENTNINVNNKVNITNVTFNKDEVVESEGTDINISFDWEAQGLHKGDTMVVPMFEGFDSVTKEVKYNFSSDSLSNMGTLVLDYNEHKIYVEYTGDIDPNKIYRGTMNIGTFVSRNYFKNEKNEAQINIPLPDGTSISKTLKVNFDQAKEWDDAYAAAINETLSEDKTRADVSWVVEVNPKKKAMKSTAVYITPDNIDEVKPFYVDGKLQSASIYYTSAQNPYTLDPDSIMVYEANITPSLGYTKGKKLVLGTDYEILRGAYDANTGSQKDNVWIVRFKGKYDVINGDQFVIEYNTHYDNLDPTLESTTGDRAVAIGTDVEANNLISYFDPNNSVMNFKGGIIYAKVRLIDSSMTSVEGENITGSVIVAHINGKTGEYLKPEAYVINGGTTLKDVKQGTPYTTSPETFDGFTFTRMGYDSAPATGTVNNSVQRVVYVYMPDELKGSVDVKYVDRTTGEVLPFADAALTTVKDNAPAGEKYDTDKKDFAGYTFVGMTEDSAAADGNVEANKTLHVIYAYDKNPEPVVEKGSVDVVYVDEQGNVLPGGELTDVKTDAPVGEKYTTEQKAFGGYTFKRMGTGSAKANGEVTKGVQHVIYVYTKDEIPEVKKGNVDVTYVTEDGKTLKATELVFKDAQAVGTDYKTEQKEFTGYHFVRMGEFSATRNGKVTENLQHVVYVYAADPVEKKGSVDVKYVTDKGEVLEDVAPAKTADGQDATNVKVGTGYNTEEKTFEGYSFKGMDKSSDPATGVVAEGTKHVIYVYTKDEVPEVKKGNVDVTYVTEDGKTLKATELVFKDAQAVGTDYKTEQKEFNGYHFVRMGQFSAARDGEVTENLQHVVYVYAADPVEKKGSVDVKYVDRATGEVLPFADAALTTVKDNAPAGEKYNTDKKDFAGYTFVGMTEDSAAADGNVEANKTLHVIYAYDKNPEPVVEKGSVDVVYVDEQGNVLPGGELTDVKKDAPVGEKYTTEQKAFDGYTFKRMGTGSAKANGEVTKGVQHVIYVYTKNPEAPKTGSVDVKFVDKTTGEMITGTSVETVKDGAPVGEGYFTTPKDLTKQGYQYVGVREGSDDPAGLVAEGTKHVVYEYEKIPAPIVKKGSVTVTYVDKDGNPLPGGEEKTVKHDVPVGEDYTTEEKDFPGYHFVGMDKTSDPANGKVTEGTKHVIYVYEKNPTPTVATDKEEEQKGSVTVTYVDKDGNPLPGGEEKTVKHDVPVGEDYTTEEKDFPGYHFVGMDKTSDPANGKVTEGTKHVIYVYEKDPTPTVATDKSEEKKDSVDVKYVDTEGNVLEGPNSVVKDGLVGSDYNTSGKTFAGYKLIGMELGSASANGKVIEGTLHVIYLYQKVTADVPTTPTATSETPTVNKVQPSVTASVTPSAAQTKLEKQSATQEALPQTGETKQNSSMLGVIALGLAGMLGLGFKKEEKENK
ncbi:MucBP domain-containing protein [Ligilactobacillus agilis]|uniref:MucBP domain-containing protein n=1 Tax=Ligilactobacillus agilis TaxID=1601 RepID=UPI001437A09B|nr:MucBP domain-containing protein [Ligilactobacillus agilis]GET18869.1 mucus-binding protein [Ligilactobacillus agilis]